MYRWPWLERRIRRRPWIGLAILGVLVALCVWILVSAPNDRSPRSGMPMWIVAVAGIVLFGYAISRYVRQMTRRDKDEER